MCHTFVLFLSVYVQFFGHPSNSLAIHILLDLNTYRGVDPLGVSPLFLKKVADIIAQKLSIVFGRLIRLGSFPESWGLLM